MAAPFPDFVLASQNPHKRDEFAQLFDGTTVCLPVPFACCENAGSYLGNALLKARTVQAQQPEVCVLADDSGLEVQALEQRPGIHSARYAQGELGPDISAAAQNQFLLAELAACGSQDRSARFVCCLVLLSPEGAICAVQATVCGEIAAQPLARTTQAFGYDPIFRLPPGVLYGGKTFAQLSNRQKQQVSHRALASRRLREMLAVL